jgi:copper chaperone CopZ
MSTPVKQSLQIADMHCVSCAMAIDGALEDVPGVQRAETNFARATTEVVFDPVKVDLATLLVVVQEAGYSATALSDRAQNGR